MEVLSQHVWRDWWKTWKTSARTTSVLAKNQTGHLPNKSLMLLIQQPPWFALLLKIHGHTFTVHSKTIQFTLAVMSLPYWRKAGESCENEGSMVIQPLQLVLDPLVLLSKHYFVTLHQHGAETPEKCKIWTFSWGWGFMLWSSRLDTTYSHGWYWGSSEKVVTTHKITCCYNPDNNQNPEHNLNQH